MSRVFLISHLCFALILRWLCIDVTFMLIVNHCRSDLTSPRLAPAPGPAHPRASDPGGGAAGGGGGAGQDLLLWILLRGGQQTQIQLQPGEAKYFICLCK